MEQINILVVTDTQVDFESGTLGTKEAQASVPNIVAKVTECGDAGYLVLMTKDTHGEDYLNTNEGKHLPVMHCIEGTPGWEIVPAINDAASKYNPVEVTKGTFGSSELEKTIRASVVKMFGQTVAPDGRNLKITFIGWCTDICVLANVVLAKTAFPEAEIIVESSCCAGVTPETHEAALTVMRSLQVNVI